eukprot:scaffold158_cov105-Cylindrotheca_fusiformis.AAC.24
MIVGSCVGHFLNGKRKGRTKSTTNNSHKWSATKHIPRHPVRWKLRLDAKEFTYFNTVDVLSQWQLCKQPRQHYVHAKLMIFRSAMGADGKRKTVSWRPW